MRKLLVLSILLLRVTISAGQETGGDQSTSLLLSLEPQVGWNSIESTLESTRYFNNYEASHEGNITFGVGVILTFNSNLVLQTGIRYLTHQTETDSINIPPVTSEDIWSRFQFEYTSINIPLKLGYNLPLGTNVVLRPEAGIVLRFLGGHDYEEIVSEPESPFREEVPPADLYDFEKFGVAAELGMTLIILPDKKISPMVNGSYFFSSSNFKLLRGNASNSTGALQAGKITEKGLLLNAGIHFKL